MSAEVKEVFLAYPFALPWIEDAVRAVVEGGGLGRVSVARDQLEAKHLLAKIEGMLENAHLCLFDLTTHNANVSLELGLAIAYGYDYSLLYCTDEKLNPKSDRTSDLFADMRGWDAIMYGNKDELEDRLRQYMPKVIAKSGTRRRVLLKQIEDELKAIDRELRTRSGLGGSKGPFLSATNYTPFPQSLSMGRYRALGGHKALQTIDPETLGALGDAYARVEQIISFEADYYRAGNSMIARNEAKLNLRNNAGPALDAIEKVFERLAIYLHRGSLVQDGHP